jgi:hypothetical protein
VILPDSMSSFKTSRSSWQGDSLQTRICWDTISERRGASTSRTPVLAIQR